MEQIRIPTNPHAPWSLPKSAARLLLDSLSEEKLAAWAWKNASRSNYDFASVVNASGEVCGAFYKQTDHDGTTFRCLVGQYLYDVAGLDVDDSESDNSMGFGILYGLANEALEAYGPEEDRVADVLVEAQILADSGAAWGLAVMTGLLNVS